MLAVLFSQSRGGTVSMIFILSLLLILLPISLKNKFFLSILLIAIAAFYGSIIGYSSVFDRFLLIQQSGQHRINIWLSSLPMLQDHLWAGAGIGSYVLLSAVYLKQFPEHIIFDRVHNDYLEFAIELGLPAALFFFLALLVFLLLFIIKIWPYTKKQFFRLPSAIIISFISAAALIGFIIHGLVDFGWRLPANLLYLATLLVLLQHGLRSTAMLSQKQ
ncbi:MAG: O-antigen ligase domain-containing protein [Candidatus Electrothrix sp. EH2]|nr:O-antigen ligase domain-containing protein [Candidatus Electrothrix sp. EH2]